MISVQLAGRKRELAGKFEAGDGNAVRFLYRTIETRRNMRDEPFKGTRNLTHYGTYVKTGIPPWTICPFSFVMCLHYIN